MTETPAEPVGAIPAKSADPTGRLLTYRVALEDGMIEHFEGHAITSPATGFLRIHRCFEGGVWQLVYGARADLVRTVRALNPHDLDRLARAQTNLNEALEHLGRLLILETQPCNYTGQDGSCVTHPNVGVDDDGECGVATAHKFIDTLRPF